MSDKQRRAEQFREAFGMTDLPEWLDTMREGFGDVRLRWARNEETGFEVGDPDETRGLR